MGDNKENGQGKTELRHIIKNMSHTDRMHHSCIERRIQQMGIHRSQHMILMYLAHNAQVSSQKELAGVFNVSTAAIANTMKTLERNGYICRVSDEEDTRKNIISITEKGRDIVEMTTMEFEAVDREMFKGITEEQLENFCNVLEILRSNLQKMGCEVTEEHILKNERMRDK